VVMESSIFWDITPCRRNQRKATFPLVSCLAYSSILKMEVICSSETSFDFQRTTWRYVAEDRTLLLLLFAVLLNVTSSLFVPLLDIYVELIQ
jgi:hypothetical protein